MGNDLEIEIRAGAAPGTYDVEVDSPAGPATGTMRLDAAAILGRRRELAATVLASAVTPRSAFSVHERPVRDVGESLFSALFADRVYGRYTASLQQAGSTGQPLRVVLRIRDPQLAGIPWEALFDPESSEYLCQREPVVRYVEAAQPSAPLAATGPLRILCMVAAPNDLAALDTAEERRRLDDALGDLVDEGLVEVVWVEVGTWSALQQKLVDGPWHVVHVVAHGGVSGRGGVLALEDEQSGASAPVSGQRFARLLHACRPVPRLVVLNSCSSGEAAAEDLLSSTAATLVHSGISAAVAMQFAVTDPAALAFSRGFYQALARNIAVDESVRLGRIAIDGTSEQTLEWVTPVIYLRTDDTRLFELTSQGAPIATREEAEEEIASEAARYGLYVQARAAIRKGRYDEAAALLDSLLTLDPTYRDAAQVRDKIRREGRLEASYEKAVSAEQSGDLETALRGFRDISATDATFRDVASRLDAVHRQLKIASLTDEMRLHADEGDWEEVLAVSADLEEVDPTQADPEGLATKARSMLAPEPPAPPTPLPEPEPEPAPVVRDLGPGPSDDGPPTRETPVIPAPDPTPDPPFDPPFDPGPPPPPFPWRRVAAIGVPVVLVLAGLGWWLLGRGGADTDTQGDDGDLDTTGQVTCWEGSTSDDGASSCPLPVGQDGLASVFPSMDGACAGAQPSVGDKEELFDCVYDGFTIRYSRWTDAADAFDFFDSHIKDAETGDWTVDGQTVGRTWKNVEDRPDEDRRQRVIAAYQDFPYDVTVKGVDEAALQEGLARVQAKLPDQIGLP